MKTARLPQHEAGPASAAAPAAASSRRAQPVRQTRINPPRSTGFGRSPHDEHEIPHPQPIDVFPALTHFTDAITSLPKDLVRHFTLLKEVDAKIFAPEEALFKLADAALKSTDADLRVNGDAVSSLPPGSAPMSAQNSSAGFSMNGSAAQAPLSTDGTLNAATLDLSKVPRQHLFRLTAGKLAEMILSLDEKAHVISTANEALSKHLRRVNDVWPYLESEFSDEAKFGSTTHWAYPENRASRANAAERSRRDGASAITAAAQQLADEAAARSDARKQAVAAKKSLKTQHQDSDLDADHDGSHRQQHTSKNETGKKSKPRKPAEPTAPVGLGITGSAPVNGANPPAKRRKVENNKEKPATNGGFPMERALSSVFGSNAAKAKTSSPGTTPGPDSVAGPAPTKKRKALPTLNGQAKKSRSSVPAAASPSVASSPVPPPLPEPKIAARAISPPPAVTAARPQSARARNNSTASSVENSRQRPIPVPSRPNGAAVSAPEPAILNGFKPVATTEAKPVKETPVPVKTEVTREELPTPTSNSITTSTTTAGGSRSRKNSVAKQDGQEPKPETSQSAPPQIVPQTIVTTKSGRASKPSTPALGSFPDPVRPRSSRNTQAGTVKRSHKKASSIAALAVQQQHAEDDATSSGQGDDEDDIDANEPRYCYCNRVSYGEMVACDADDCEKEWFHLECVGLKSAPSSSTKWYCDTCKVRMKNGKKVNGR